MTDRRGDAGPPPAAAAVAAAAAATRAPAAPPPPRRPRATSGWPATSTATPCTPTARWRSSSWPALAAGPRPRPARRHRPQHRQPPCPPRRRRRPRRDPPPPRPGGDHRRRARQLLRRDRLDRLPRAARRVAGRGHRARRRDVGQPPVGVGLRLAACRCAAPPTSSRCGTGRGTAATPSALTDWPSFGRRAIGGSDFHRPGDGRRARLADDVAGVRRPLRRGRARRPARTAGSPSPRRRTGRS